MRTSTALAALVAAATFVACAGSTDNESLEAQVSDLRDQLDEATATADDLAEQVDALTEERDRLQAELDAAPTTAAPTTAPRTTVPRTTTTAAPATTTTMPPTTPPPAPITVDELNASVGAAAAAWAVLPSGPGFDALAAAVNAVLDSGRPLPAAPDRTPEQVREVLERLKVYPGADSSVMNNLNGLRAVLPSLPPAFQTGSWVVGTEVVPGTYRSLGEVEDCYWETLDAAGEINDNNFILAAPQALMTVRPGDFAVNSERCGWWIKVN